MLAALRLFGPALLVFVSVVKADTSLYIPDADPQPISAGLIGVGSDGRTTWEIQQGSATGTFTDPGDDGFLGGATATLVEGPSDAVMTIAVSSGDFIEVGAISCTINNGLADCVRSVSEGGSLFTDTITETASPFLVQGGGSFTTSGSGPTSTATSGSQASAASTASSSGASATGTASGKNSAGRIQISGERGFIFVVGVVLACFL